MGPTHRISVYKLDIPFIELLMILLSAHVKNFRSLRDVKVNFDKQTAILGANGAGKSTILKALERFYGSATQASLDDFFSRNIDDPIEIALTFSEFTTEEERLFRSRIANNEMTVVRVFDARGGRNSGKYFGITSGFPPFQAIRQADGAAAQRSLYSSMKASDTHLFASLASVKRADEIEGQLLRWEGEHLDMCEPIRDDGQFLGFTNVGNGSLKRSTSFVFIPAVRDAASDAFDGKGSAIAKLMELVVRNAIHKRAEIQDWQAAVSARYRELTDPANLTELGELAATLTTTLKTLYEETAVNLTWKPSADFEIPLPTALVALEDAGYEAPVELQGNGLQRAFILTLLQHLAMATIAGEAEREREVSPGEGVLDTLTANLPPVPVIPGLILAIEEPELYQHPTKQRHFAKVLSLLSDGSLPGVVTKTQIIFASHSPYFVCMDRFNQVRLARRNAHPHTGLRECSLREAELNKVVRMLEHSRDVPNGFYTSEALLSKLHIVTPELSEGFFADVVLLVEGETDKAALRAAASLKGVDLEALGVAVLQAGGKGNLDRPAAIFMTLEIPVFVVWDCDRRDESIDDEASNRALQRLFGVEEQDIVGAGKLLGKNFACFEQTLEKELAQAFGIDELATAISSTLARFGLREKKDAIKAAPVMHQVLLSLQEGGKRCSMLDQIIDGAIALKGTRTPDPVARDI